MAEEHAHHEEGKSHGKKHGKGHGHGGGGHEEAHEGAPEWLISFADNVMLQMGFFVILLALNMGPKAKSEQEGDGTANGATQATPDLIDFQIAVRQAFNSGIDPVDPRDAPLRKRMIDRQTQGDTREPGPDGDEKDRQGIEPSDYYAPVGIVAFEVGLAELSPTAKKTVVALNAQLTGRREILEVRGHVSAAEAFKDETHGFQLAYDRAFAVAEEFVAQGMKRGRIRVVVCGDASPVQQRADTPDQHRSNQRVEILQTQELMPRDPFGEQPTP